MSERAVLIRNVVRAWVMSGKVEALGLYQSEQFPWDRMIGPTGSLAALIPAVNSMPGGKRSERTILELLHLAVKDGREDVLSTVVVKHPHARAISLVDPILTLMRCGFDEALTFYLDRGFDPHAKHGARGFSAIDVAEQTGLDSMAGMMRAYLARRQTLGIIEHLSPINPPGPP